MPGRSFLNRLARTLPDIPRWVETRSMLLSGWCEVFGLEEDGETCFVVRDIEYQPISVVGHPARTATSEAVARRWDEDVVIAPPEIVSHVRAALPGWTSTQATLHLLGDESRLLCVPPGACRLLERLEIDSVEGLTRELRSELDIAARRSPIAVSLSGNRPVSFCYAAVRTENLWDISIDTLGGLRNQGHAARCVSYMVEHMRHLGKQPVWGAEETNRVSLRLAEKLGFVPVDEVTLLRRPDNEDRESIIEGHG